MFVIKTLTTVHPRLSELRLTEPRLSEPRLSEPRLSKPRLSEPRLSEPRLSEQLINIPHSCFQSGKSPSAIKMPWKPLIHA